MKTKRYEHGVAFEEKFNVTLRGEVRGEPVGWGDSGHEKAWLEEALKEAVTEAISRFYQCRLEGTRLEIELP